MNWESAALVGDPFLVEAPRGKQQRTWADMRSVKRRLEVTLQDAVGSGVTQVIFNRGAWGMGKTHAAYYFSDPEILHSALPDSKKGSLIGVYIRCPSEPSSAAADFFYSVVYGIGWERIQAAFVERLRVVGEEVFKSEALAKTHDPDMSQGLFLLASPEWDPTLVRKYLIGGTTTPTELTRLGVARTLGKLGAQQKTVLLSVLLQGVLGGFDGPPEKSMFLWIDETEDLNLFPGRAVRQITSVWRDLIDLVPMGLAVYLNYTPGRGEEGDIQQILGPALVTRITAIIPFEPLSEEDAVHFVRDLLNDDAYRPKELTAKATSQTYPFQQDAVDLIVSKLRTRTPRHINIAFGQILRTALRENLLGDDPATLITAEFVEGNWGPIGEIMEREDRLIG